MKLQFHTLDVFTAERFGGNPVAVVQNADMLPTSLMQTIAAEFNLSETVFVMKPKNPAHTARVRIFTPGSELPFAGHPTLGTAALLAKLRQVEEGSDNCDAIVLLEEEVGPVRVGVSLGKNGVSHAEFTAPQLPEVSRELPSNDDLAAAIGLIPSELGFENYRPLRVSAGNAFIFIPVGSRDVLDKAWPVQPNWDHVGGDSVGGFVYCHDPVHTTATFQARMFAPHHGVPEDPATGSAAAAFAGVVHEFDSLRDGTHKRVIEQGFQMGRESFINLQMVVSQGKLSAVRISGDVVQVSAGSIEI